ncbi:TetR family transcriptional regulator [Streptomyces sp. VNUA116]|uniref:TetR family transcriptional regulator n=1 Tax=Streptomyces sp. VNUA116 TaxID=3062449 RepID=UPI00267475BD|nr:TetR family transcriptional regulator [Streptomyces sp. VNUA116]WKU48165.1 TetR family transcriptional regulator [Streptomyces sp. VNUA116]
MRKTAEEAAQTRAALLEAALFVFAEQGLASARLADVAQRAGLTRGALYYHFADKSALYAAVMEHSWATVTEPVWDLLSSGEPPEERLRAFLTTWLHRLRHDARFRALLTLTLDSSYDAAALPAGLPEGRAAKASGLADWQLRLEALCDEHAAAAPGAPAAPASAAANLLAWLCGTALLAATDPALLPPDDAEGVAPVLRGLLS